MKAMIAMVTMVLCGLLSAAPLGGRQGGPATLTYKTLTIGDMVLRSVVDGKNLKVRISAPTTGWIAVGFGPKSAMKGANFIIGYAAGGQVVLQDEFGVSAYRHRPDGELGGKDDILERSAGATANGTEIAFTIPLDSGDPFDVKLEPGKTIPIILAYGRTTDLTKRHAKKYSVDLAL